MVANFENLLMQINEAESRSKLEQAFDNASTLLTTWLNTFVITPADYKDKVNAARQAYNDQLIDFIEINEVTHIVDTKEISNILFHPAQSDFRMTIHFKHTHVLTTRVSAGEKTMILGQLVKAHE